MSETFAQELKDIFDDNKDTMGSVAYDKADITTDTLKNDMDELCSLLESEIIDSKASEEEKKHMLKNLRTFYNTETNIMLVGATGSGKSSTINALFSIGDKTGAEGETENERHIVCEVAKIGSKADPETKDIEKYRIGNLILWDTPGFGDGTENDEHHRNVITELLREKNSDGKRLIDFVLVVMDASSKDLGTTYIIINEVIIPELDGDTDKILIVLNQADVSMKTGRHWNYEKNEPDEILMKFLDEKAESIRKRIKEDTNLDIVTVYYCSGYSEENGDTVKPYNLAKLLYYILSAIPAQNRLSVMEGVNTDKTNFEHNDGKEDYNNSVRKEYFDAVDAFSKVGDTILGLPGFFIGATIGGVVESVKAIIEVIF